ncbi:plasmid maintenance system killer protein [Francisella halioticida]|uniref:Plasmid maintenance system killer protein n=1 Tax=Francisella halioticida TaxID=549298 RepID=A0ABM6M252_9GAMM|nr:type II toxin-antitoxin system RelE/ParE family toxin [Francisella halioticida]ASG68930.1 plasmid maintenance system killer protein [Francisella halioticida]BCD92210.1 plasmid maintenance system killer protein [Francisella halioticida]
MIINFASQSANDIYNGVSSKHARKIPNTIYKTAIRKLDMVNAAKVIEDLRIPPNNRLEQLKGNLKEYHSIRINDQYRVIFKWKDNNAYDVDIVDYH